MGWGILAGVAIAAVTPTWASLRVRHIISIYWGRPRRVRILFIVLSVLPFAGEAFAEKRVALVIGNASYSHAPALDNPVNDVTAMSVMLEGAGFQVVETRSNLDNMAMRRAIRDFSAKTRDADVAVVFYAGHGLEVDGTNYLIPTDAKLATDIDVEDEAISLDRPPCARACKKLAARDPRRLPRQSLRQDHETDAGITIGRPRSRRGRADHLQYPDCLRSQSRVDGERRRWRAQPIYQRPGETSHRAGTRPPARLRQGA
jgi:Caspase domain